jgi:DNA-binding GntR family transcriptional regulator
VRATGVKPRIDEHTAILKALRQRDADGAREAMREHLTRVIDALLKATEVQELERARQQIAEQRKRYVANK